MTPSSRAEKWKPRTLSAWWLLIVFFCVSVFTKGLMRRSALLSHLEFAEMAADIIGYVTGILTVFIIYFLTGRALRRRGIYLSLGGRKSMTEGEREQWRKMRRRGMAHFVLFLGVLRWGFPCGVISSVVFFLLGNFLSAASGGSTDFSLMGFLHVLFYGLVRCVFAGTAFGFWIWIEQDEAYDRAKRDSSALNFLTPDTA